MVKGISKQVIVVQSPDPKLFEQAIFILKEDAIRSGGISEEILLKEAHRLMNEQGTTPKRYYGTAYLCAGAVVMGLVWLLTMIL